MEKLLKENIKPELLVIIPVLYLIGMSIKKSSIIDDKYIPLILGICGIILSALYIFAGTEITDVKSTVMMFFSSITQGILCAGATVYTNQLFKQLK